MMSETTAMAGAHGPAGPAAGAHQPAPAVLRVRQVRELPAREARFAPWPDWLGPGSPLRRAVEGVGVDRLWEHQRVAADALMARRHVVLTTGTASGKSLAYLLPIAAAETGVDGPTPDPARPGPSLSARGLRWRRRPATSLYLAPTKALAHDQARVCAELGLSGWRVATVDGDTDPADRGWARDHAHHILTNPDLLHASLLPHHQRWASFLRSLRYVVVDESHRYRGVFGAQVAAVLRRLRRVADHYGAAPTFAVLSATAPEPGETAARLTGIPPDELVTVDADGSPRGPVRIELAGSELAAEDAAAELMADRVRAGHQVLTFVPSRRLAEEVARDAAALAGAGEGAVVAYRAGYLAADRRLIERGLSEGTTRGVAATNALELGVDIAGLDSVVMCGYPGTRAAFWQQAGRAGRRGAAADVVLIARPNPLDAYLLDHPEALFEQPVETQVLEAASPAVLGPQLAAAAQELPLRPGDERWFGATTWRLVAGLTGRGLLRERPDGWYWTAPQRAVDRISLRSTEAASLDIVERRTGRVLGTVARSAEDLVVHPGAVYLHQGDCYVCDDVDHEAAEAYVHAARPGYLTQPVVDADMTIGAADSERVLGGGLITYGPATVRSTVTGFLRRDEVSGRIWDSTPLDCPERVLSTTAMALRLQSRSIPAPTAAGGSVVEGEQAQLDRLSRSRLDAGLHALEHLLVGLLPAVVANDRGDVGAHSWFADGVGVVAVFDRQLGSGFAARAYQHADDWLVAALDRITSCPCEAGCPACILAAGCSSRRPLDKSAGRLLLVSVVHPGGSPSAADTGGR